MEGTLTVVQNRQRGRAMTFVCQSQELAVIQSICSRQHLDGSAVSGSERRIMPLELIYLITVRPAASAHMRLDTISTRIHDCKEKIYFSFYGYKNKNNIDASLALPLSLPV